MRKWIAIALGVFLVLATALVLLERKAANGGPATETRTIEIKNVLDR